jgi:hypothetical protein
MTDERKYSDEEVRAIIDRALARDASEPGGLTHSDLLAVGEQVGVPAAAMTRAAEAVRTERLARVASEAITGRRRRWLARHAAVFAVINGLLFAVNAATTPGQWWVLFPVFFWGLALMLHAGLAFGTAPSPRALERERRRLAPTKVRIEAEESKASNEESAEARRDEGTALTSRR